MPTQNETFLMAKMNILEHVNAQMMVIFFALLKMRGGSSDFEHNLRKAVRERAAVRQGSAEGAFELQTEMLKQLDNYFSLVRYYEENTTAE